MEKLRTFLTSIFAKHLFFWIIVFSIQIASNWDNFPSTNEMFHVYIFKFGLQLISAYICLWIVLPRYVSKNRTLELVVIIFVLILGLHCTYTAWRMLFLEPTYPESYVRFFEIYGHRTFLERAFTIKLLFAKEAALYLFPALLLVTFQYFQKEQKLSKINEQKKISELNALKNQLNPHFLFNSLNNLYSLAIKKADETPEVISRLSDILDYMLYRTNDHFVPIDKEISMIENYLALEKIRYNKRVEINLSQDVQADVRIAPLLLLTFIENAFKHGVSQEINVATIDIQIKANAQNIEFMVFNTIPKSKPASNDRKDAIGLKNVKQQLELLYPKAHTLNIEEKAESYRINLKLESK